MGGVMTADGIFRLPLVTRRGIVNRGAVMLSKPCVRVAMIGSREGMIYDVLLLSNSSGWERAYW